MSDLAPPTAEAPTPPSAGLEMLTSPKSMTSTPGAPVSESPTPLYRKKRPANEDASTARWRAVCARDRSADGSFVFAVSTTGIYCRPSCPARRPLQENVGFFEEGGAARAAGFRACIGLSPKQYTLAHRAERLKREIGKGRTVLDAGFEAGYGSASRVYDEAARKLGMTPGRFRAGGRGVRIAFSTRATELGRLLLAVTDRGLCAVRLGDDDEAVRAALAAEFPNATLVETGLALAPLFAQIAALLEGDAAPPPLDIQATAFQALVWQALQRIPRGTTVSYGELARALGRPKAARAVARACATNPVAVVVPCHRVVGADGVLTGYRWGVKRKQALLALEAATSSSRRRAAPR